MRIWMRVMETEIEKRANVRDNLGKKVKLLNV